MYLSNSSVGVMTCMLNFQQQFVKTIIKSLELFTFCSCI